MKRALIPAIMLFLLAPSAWAATEMGLGGGSCGLWTAARRIRSSADFEQWVLGYLSGVGAVALNLDPLNRVDAFGVWAWIDNYCQAHPIERVTDAAKAFANAHPN